jgi:hypothetical protein
METPRLPVQEIIGTDLDVSRRPGYQSHRAVGPWPNTRYPPERQPGEPASPLHGRPGKTMPPVFGTSCPPHGISGAIRKVAYGYPDHLARHWVMLLFADRVEAVGPRARRLLKYGLPVLVAGGAFGSRWRRQHSRNPDAHPGNVRHGHAWAAR